MQTTYDVAHTITDAAKPGIAVYSKPLLAVYDLAVVGFQYSVTWRCPARYLLKLYNKHVSSNHLDVGVGTGYFLDKCTFPTPNPKIALADLNPNTLEVSSKRIKRYHPTTYLANVLEPLPIQTERFDSIGLNHLLHCLPGTMRSKAVVFKNLKPLLNEGGVLFGATVLGQGVDHGRVGKFMLKRLNASGAFSNTQDNLADLEQALKENFRTYSVRMIGSVALFVART